MTETANGPKTHEERLARDIFRCQQLAKELCMTSTEHYLRIAFSKLKDERAERISRGK